MRALLFTVLFLTSTLATAEDSIQNLPEIVEWAQRWAPQGDRLWRGTVKGTDQRCDFLLYVEPYPVNIALSLSGPLPRGRGSFNAVPGITINPETGGLMTRATSRVRQTKIENGKLTVRRMVAIGAPNQTDDEVEITLNSDGRPLSVIGRTYSPDSQLECEKLK